MGEVREGTLELDGAPVAYDVRGSGAAVVLVHPGLGDRRAWDEQTDALARDHTVVRYDLRGFGRSPDPVGPYAHHDQLLALMDHLSLPRASLIGCSLGSYVALTAAALSPHRVDRLALVSPVLDGVEPTECVARFWKDEAEALEAGDIERAVELNLVTWVDGPHRDASDVDPALRARVAEMQTDVFRHARAGDEHELAPPASKRLKAVELPTLVLTGALDERWILDCADALVAGLPDARPAQVPDSAHVPMLESPDTVTELLLDHLA